MRKTRVLIIEDSAVTRQVLTRIINSDHELEVVDSAIDPFIAVKKIEKFLPDVITLDLELPRMDGLTFLQKLMNNNPLPVVVISGVSDRGSRNAIRALELGAVEVITKPDVSSPEKMITVSQNIRLAIKAAHQAKVKRIVPNGLSLPDLSALSVVKKSTASRQSSDRIIVIGASTGGTEALRSMLAEFEPGCPGILIVQHMPEMFTKSFAERLNALSKIQVKEAEHNDEVKDGCALIAPGNKHMTLKQHAGKFFVHLSDTEKVNRHRPSVDVLFRSAAELAGPRTQAVLLTGMGEDGAAGMLEIKNAGGYTIAQNKETSVVFGMPRRAAELGAATQVLALDKIVNALTELSN